MAEEVKITKLFRAPCPIGLMLIAAGRAETSHPAEYSITSKDTLRFNCSKCNAHGFINGLEAIEVILSNKELP